MIFFTVGIHLYEVSLYSFFCKKRKRQKKKNDELKFLKYSHYMNQFMWLSICISCCFELASPKLCYIFVFLSQDFLTFYASLWFTNFGESTFLTHSHELHSLQSPVKKGVGCCVFGFFFHEILPRLWAATRGLKKPKKQEYYTSL